MTQHCWKEGGEAVPDFCGRCGEPWPCVSAQTTYDAKDAQDLIERLTAVLSLGWKNADELRDAILREMNRE